MIERVVFVVLAMLLAPLIGCYVSRSSNDIRPDSDSNSDLQSYDHSCIVEIPPRLSLKEYVALGYSLSVRGKNAHQWLYIFLGEGWENESARKEASSALHAMGPPLVPFLMSQFFPPNDYNWQDDLPDGVHLHFVRTHMIINAFYHSWEDLLPTARPWLEKMMVDRTPIHGLSSQSTIARLILYDEFLRMSPGALVAFITTCEDDSTIGLAARKAAQVRHLSLPTAD